MTVRADRLPIVGTRPSVRRIAVDLWSLVRRSDLAWVYAGILIAVVIVLSALGGDTYSRVVSASSTNLANLRDRPWAVLVASAFVVSSPWGLWITPFLVIVYAAAQRFVGRLATVIVAAFGHIGATLVVATGLSAGIADGRLVRRLVVHETDVGVSYALVCLAAFVVWSVPRPYRWGCLVVLVGYVAIPFAVAPSFTGVGHTIALVLGGLLALVGARAARRAKPVP